ASNLGNVYLTLGRIADAARAYDRALAARPSFAEAQHNLGVALEALGRLEEARAAYERAYQLRPTRADSANNLANVLQYQGKPEEALGWFQRAREAEPTLTYAHSNALASMQYCPGVTLAGLATAHAEWDRLHAAGFRSAWRDFVNVPDPERPLRLG